jgi:hypothetical protein
MLAGTAALFFCIEKKHSLQYLAKLASKTEGFIRCHEQKVTVSQM